MNTGSESVNVLIDRVVKEVDVVDLLGRHIVRLVTHDGHVVMISGDNALITSQKLD